MTKPLTKKAKYKLDAEIARIYRATCANITIPLLDIGKIYKAGYAAVEAGTDLTTAIVSTVAAIRVN